MKLLVDTHIMLILDTDPELIAKKVRGAIDEAEKRYFSSASTWELAIKASSGKLRLPMQAGEYAQSRMRAMMFEPLAVTHAHAGRVEALPLLHKDPFDRLLIAQAQLEGLTLVTRDAFLARYPGIRVLKAGA